MPQISNNPIDFGEPREHGWRQATQLVRGGSRRTEFGETSEALFLNSGFVYDSAETAESRFDGSAPGFVYSRYNNPTLDCVDCGTPCFSTDSAWLTHHGSFSDWVDTRSTGGLQHSNARLGNGGGRQPLVVHREL